MAKAVFLVLLLVGLIVLGGLRIQDARYAHAVFSGKVDYDEVLASRRWNTGARPYGCSYAVVSLKESAGHLPPTTWFGHHEYWFGRNEYVWTLSPVLIARLDHLSYPNNAISECAAKGYFSPDVVAKLERAASEPGSYYLHLGESLALYSQPHGIAAVVRYGD